ncbi:hypothetical protein B0H17DRAFT_907397, partial [Mycena rosella]
YNNISALRQQLQPTHRVHGIFDSRVRTGRRIVTHTSVCYVRAPMRAEQEQTMKCVRLCFEAAALATGCTVKITVTGGTYDLRQNKALG